MQPQPRPARFRAALAGALTLALALSLAACGGGGGKPKAAPPAAGAPVSGSPAGSVSAPPQSGPDVQLPTGPEAAFTKARDTSAGPIMLTTLSGKKSGVSAKVWTWVPPQYNDPKYAHYGFPVVILYAGGQSAGYNTWTDNQLPIEEEDAQLAHAGQASPFILIMPVQNLNSNESKSLDCSDIPGQPKMGTWMSQDVPDFVKANFRTLKSRDGWAMMGASTGAFCSAKLALQHPDQFKAAVPIDGYWDPDSPLWKGHEPERLANSPLVLVGQGTADVQMLATAGGGNAYEVHLVTAWVARAKPPVTVDYYEQPHGQHLTVDFKKMIPLCLQWLTKHLAAPTDN